MDKYYFKLLNKINFPFIIKANIRISKVNYLILRFNNVIQ